MTVLLCFGVIEREMTVVLSFGVIEREMTVVLSFGVIEKALRNPLSNIHGYFISSNAD